MLLLTSIICQVLFFRLLVQRWCSFHAHCFPPVTAEGSAAVARRREIGVYAHGCLLYSTTMVRFMPPVEGTLDVKDPRRVKWPNLHIASLDIPVVRGRCSWFCHCLYCAIRTPSSILQDGLNRTLGEILPILWPKRLEYAPQGGVAEYASKRCYKLGLRQRATRSSVQSLHADPIVARLC
jgi:hypothetical protein